MTSSHDYTGYADKDYLRRLPWEAVKHSFNLVDADEKLRFDWVELAGEHAPTCSFLKEQGALEGRGRFVGVDREAYIIEAARRAHPKQIWIQSDLSDALKAHEQPVGVLVYDSEDGIHKDLQVLRSELVVLRRYALRQRALTREFVLVLNFCASPHFLGGKGNWTRYVNLLNDVFGSYMSHKFALCELGASDGKAIPVYRYVSTGTPMLWTMILL